MLVTQQFVFNLSNLVDESQSRSRLGKIGKEYDASVPFHVLVIEQRHLLQETALGPNGSCPWRVEIQNAEDEDIPVPDVQPVSDLVHKIRDVA